MSVARTTSALSTIRSGTLTVSTKRRAGMPPTLMVAAGSGGAPFTISVQSEKAACAVLKRSGVVERGKCATTCDPESGAAL